MLYDKTASLYQRTTNAKHVTSYPATPTKTIAVNIQPIGDVAWLDWMQSFNTYNLFTPELTVKEWDKIIQWTNIYIVKWTQNREWIMDKYSLCIVDLSKWT